LLAVVGFRWLYYDWKMYNENYVLMHNEQERNMGHRYDRDLLETKIVNALKENVKGLYREDFLNYTSNIQGTKDRCTEFVAQYLLNQGSEFNAGSWTIQRTRGYTTASHDGEHDWSGSNQEEKKIAYEMRNRSQKEKHHFAHIGEILDYEVPLSKVDGDNSGEIDLLSWNKEKNELILLELKKPDSTETLLRCVLEVYTYWKVVWHERLAKDFGRPDASVRAAVLVFASSQKKKSQPYEDWKSTEQPHIRELMKGLDVGLYVLESETDLNVTKER